MLSLQQVGRPAFAITAVLLLCLSLVVQLLAFTAPVTAAADGNRRLVRRFDWQPGSDGAVRWATDCDWVGGDYAHAASASDACGGVCVADPACTHFTWDAGTCWLKNNGTNPTAVLKLGAVCGWAQRTPARVLYAGVNEAGLEFGITTSDGPAAGSVPGVLGTDFFAPDPAAVAHTRARFANIFRLPFMWERLQASLYADFEEDYLAILKSSVATVTDTGASVIVDPHNFARYNGTLVTGPDLADLWSRLARIYGNNSQVVFGLVNEPHGIDAAAWFAIAQQAADAIRATGADNLILVPGNCYTQAEVWTSGLCDSGGLFTANGAAALAFHDPNFAFEMHQYYDIGFGGTDATCLWDASLVLSSATTWLRENSRRGFLGETGVSSSAACLATLQEALTLLDDNSDVWMGYTYWAAGSGWGDYFMSVESTSNSTDNAIFDILAEHPGLL